MAGTKIECAHCGRRYNSKMKYCPFCRGETEKPLPDHDPTCPRCRCVLEPLEFRDTEVDRCPQCAGMWLDNDEFDYLTSERDVYRDDSIPRKHLRRPLAPESGYVPCARCGNLMNRLNFKKISGVLIDVCGDHGIWLDAEELAQIRSWVAHGGLDRAQDGLIEKNRVDLEELEGRVDDLEWMETMLHLFNPKRWVFRKF